MTVADLAIIAGLVFAWGTWSARLERFDVTAPIVFTVAGVLLTHGPLAPLGITPGTEVVKVLTDATLALVLFSDASRVGLHPLRAPAATAPGSPRHQRPPPRPDWPRYPNDASSAARRLRKRESY